MISVIIPSYRNPEYLEFCLEVALHNQSKTNEFIVIVDGYVDMYAQVIRDFPQVTWIKFEENTGLPFALNTGVQYANNARILIINEDNVLPIGWDVVCENVYSSDTAISFMQVEPEQSIFHFLQNDFGKSPKEFQMEKFLKWELHQRMTYHSQSAKACLFPFLISKERYMMVGGFDTSYSSPFVVDLDFWYKLQLANMNFKTSYDMIVYHFGSRSTKKSNENNTDWNANERLGVEQFIAKWGFVPTRNEQYRVVSSNGLLMRGIEA